MILVSNTGILGKKFQVYLCHRLKNHHYRVFTRLKHAITFYYSVIIVVHMQYAGCFPHECSLMACRDLMSLLYLSGRASELDTGSSKLQLLLGELSNFFLSMSVSLSEKLSLS